MVANVGDLPWVVMVALIVLVGGSQLPKIARNVGLAGKEFRKAQDEMEQEAAAKAGTSDTTSAPPPAIAIAPTAAPVTATTAAAPAEPAITLTPAQLDALLKAREEQVRSEETTN
jgi:Sec-independent protein translocase protein TatA